MPYFSYISPDEETFIEPERTKLPPLKKTASYDQTQKWYEYTWDRYWYVPFHDIYEKRYQAKPFVFQTPHSDKLEAWLRITAESASRIQRMRDDRKDRQERRDRVYSLIFIVVLGVLVYLASQ